MGTRHEGSMPRAVQRAVTAAVEYGVARAGIAAVRALDHDVIGQAHHPRGAAGRVTAWEMAHRPSNRQRNGWVVSLLGVQPADHVLEIGFGPASRSRNWPATAGQLDELRRARARGGRIAIA